MAFYNLSLVLLTILHELQLQTVNSLRILINARLHSTYLLNMMLNGFNISLPSRPTIHLLLHHFILKIPATLPQLNIANNAGRRPALSTRALTVCMQLIRNKYLQTISRLIAKKIKVTKLGAAVYLDCNDWAGNSPGPIKLFSP